MDEGRLGKWSEDELEDEDAIVILHNDGTLDVIVSDDEMTMYYAHMISFMMTDQELLSQVEKKFDEYLDTKFDQLPTPEEKKERDGKKILWKPEDLN